MAGLLEMFNPQIGQNPLYQRFDKNRDLLTGTLLGGVGAESPKARMRGMAQGALQGQQQSRLYEQELAKQRQAENQLNATMQAFQKAGQDDLISAVQGGLPMGEAWKEFLTPKNEATDTMRNLEWRAQQAGLQPGTPEYNNFMISGGSKDGVTVNVGDGAPGLGKLSADYGYVLDPTSRQPVIDPATGLPRAAPVPGSPAAQDANRATASAESKEEQSRTWNLIVNDEIGRALNIVESGGLIPTTGLGAETAAGIGGTAARDLKGLLDTVKANAGFDHLQAMRDASPTGGALGQVSERELAFLQSTIGNLEQSQSKEQLTYNLKRLKKIYSNMLEGKRAYDGLLESSDDALKEGWTDLGNGVRIRKLD